MNIWAGQRAVLFAFKDRFFKFMERDPNHLISYSDMYEIDKKEMSEEDDLELNGRLVTDIVMNPFRPKYLLKT